MRISSLSVAAFLLAAWLVATCIPAPASADLASTLSIWNFTANVDANWDASDAWNGGACCPDAQSQVFITAAGVGPYTVTLSNNTLIDALTVGDLDGLSRNDPLKPRPTLNMGTYQLNISSIATFLSGAELAWANMNCLSSEGSISLGPDVLVSGGVVDLRSCTLDIYGNVTFQGLALFFVRQQITNPGQITLHPGANLLIDVSTLSILSDPLVDGALEYNFDCSGAILLKDSALFMGFRGVFTVLDGCALIAMTNTLVNKVTVSEATFINSTFLTTNSLQVSLNSTLISNSANWTVSNETSVTMHTSVRVTDNSLISLQNVGRVTMNPDISVTENSTIVVDASYFKHGRNIVVSIQDPKLATFDRANLYALNGGNVRFDRLAITRSNFNLDTAQLQGYDNFNCTDSNVTISNYPATFQIILARRIELGMSGTPVTLLANQTSIQSNGCTFTITSNGRLFFADGSDLNMYNSTVRLYNSSMETGTATLEHFSEISLYGSNSSMKLGTGALTLKDNSKFILQSGAVVDLQDTLAKRMDSLIALLYLASGFFFERPTNNSDPTINIDSTSAFIMMPDSRVVGVGYINGTLINAGGTISYRANSTSTIFIESLLQTANGTIESKLSINATTNNPQSSTHLETRTAEIDGKIVVRVDGDTDRALRNGTDDSSATARARLQPGNGGVIVVNSSLSLSGSPKLQIIVEDTLSGTYIAASDCAYALEKRGTTLMLVFDVNRPCSVDIESSNSPPLSPLSPSDTEPQPGGGAPTTGGGFTNGGATHSGSQFPIAAVAVPVVGIVVITGIIIAVIAYVPAVRRRLFPTEAAEYEMKKAKRNMATSANPTTSSSDSPSSSPIKPLVWKTAQKPDGAPTAV